VRFECLRHRRKVAIVVNRQHEAYQARAGTAKAPRLLVGGVLMLLRKVTDQLGGAFFDAPFAPGAIQNSTDGGCGAA